MSLSREDRERRERVRGQVLGELGRARFESWIAQAAASDEAGPVPEVPAGLQAWRERDPEGFAGYLSGLVSKGYARRARAESPAEGGRDGEGDTGLGLVAAAAAAGVLLSVVAVVLIIRRRRRRRREDMNL